MFGDNQSTMKIADYPFNLELLIGRTVSWIPSKDSSAWRRYYAEDRRWKYTITRFSESSLHSPNNILVFLSDSEGGTYSFTRLDMLEILDLED